MSPEILHSPEDVTPAAHDRPLVQDAFSGYRQSFATAIGGLAALVAAAGTERQTASANVPPQGEQSLQTMVREPANSAPYITPGKYDEIFYKLAISNAGFPDKEQKDFTPKDYEQLRTILTGLLGSTSRAEQEWAAWDLGQIGGHEALPQLHRLMDGSNKNQMLAEYSARSIGRLARTNPKAAEIFGKQVFNNPRFSTYKALSWLAEAGPADPKNESAKNLDAITRGIFEKGPTPGDSTSAAITLFMRKTADADHVDHMASRLGEKTEEIDDDGKVTTKPAYSATVIFAFMHEQLPSQHPDVVKRLAAKAIAEADPYVRHALGAALTNMIPEGEALDAIKTLMTDPDVSVRGCVALRSATHPGFREPLRKQLLQYLRTEADKRIVRRVAAAMAEGETDGMRMDELRPFLAAGKE